MNKIFYSLMIVTILCFFFQLHKNRENKYNLGYMKNIIESKNNTINNLIKDNLYDIDDALYASINQIDSSLLKEKEKIIVCLYLSAETHCDACIEFELKYIRKNKLENNISILYNASHKSSFYSFKEFNKDMSTIFFCSEITKFNSYPTYLIIKDGKIKQIYKSNTTENGGALNYFLSIIKNLN